MRAAAPAFSSEKVDHPTGTPAHNVTPTEQAKAPEAVKEEPKAASFAPVKEEPKLEPKVEEVKIDEHAGAVDYEKSATVNIMAPAVKEAYDARKPRSVKDYPELKEYYNISEQKLRNKKTGDTWTGGVVRGVPHGWGMFVTKNGEVLEGLFSEGHHVSHMRQIQADGTIYEGDFKNGKRQGKGVVTNADGSTIICNTWTDGTTFGTYEQTDSTGKVIFKGARNAKGLDGPCVSVSKDYTVEGTFKDGVATAATKKYNNGRSYTGALDKDLVEEGQGTFTFVDGRKFQGNFTKGLPNGEGTFTSDTGKVSKQTWKNGRRA